MNERQFYEVIEAWRNRPFDWRTANCCHLAADAAAASGFDFQMPEFEGPADAANWIREQGADSLRDLMVQWFGPPVAPLQAKRGFLAYREGVGLDGSCVGIVDRRALFVGDTGLVDVPLFECACAFDPANG